MLASQSCRTLNDKHPFLCECLPFWEQFVASDHFSLCALIFSSLRVACARTCVWFWSSTQVCASSKFGVSQSDSNLGNFAVAPSHPRNYTCNFCAELPFSLALKTFVTNPFVRFVQTLSHTTCSTESHTSQHLQQVPKMFCETFDFKCSAPFGVP